MIYTRYSRKYNKYKNAIVLVIHQLHFIHFIKLRQSSKSTDICQRTTQQKELHYPVDRDICWESVGNLESMLGDVESPGKGGS